MNVCTEISISCDYLEHRKCDGAFICPDNGLNESCACNCHFPGNEHIRTGRIRRSAGSES